MAVVDLYDSGAGGLPADVWCQHRFASALSPSPVRIAIQVEPLVTPDANWNLFGYAALESLEQGSTVFGLQTPIPSLTSSVPGSWVIISRLELKPSDFTAISGLRGVHWVINRWVGRSRIRLRYFT
jgi:hypothetical protein